MQTTADMKYKNYNKTNMEEIEADIVAEQASVH
jgi:hypothetical protein